MKIRIGKTPLVVVAVIVVVTVTILIWFNFEKAIVYFKIHSPLPKQWATLQLSNGEILYGHVTGATQSFLALKDVYLLEKYTEASSLSREATSENFSISDSPPPTPEKRLIPTKKTDTLFINREAILYWQYLIEDDPMILQLK